jgi:hypothetical protein
MRIVIFALILLPIAVAAQPIVDPSDAAKAILSQAIKAAGGEQNLKRFLKRQEISKCVLFGSNGEVTCDHLTWFSDPFQYRYEASFARGERKFLEIAILDDNTYWLKRNDGRIAKDSGKDMEEVKRAVRHQNLRLLFPLLEKRYSLLLIGNKKDGQKELIGL